MASVNKITDVIAAIKTIYPYYAKDSDVKLLANTWGALLKPYDDKTVDAAMFKCLQTCKTPPTPADVIEQIHTAQKALEISDEELWEVYVRALESTFIQMRYFPFTFVDDTGISQGQRARNEVDKIWGNLPDKIKRYIASKGELMRNARLYAEDDGFLSYEKPRFMRAMPIMAKRQEYSAFMLEGKERKMIEGD